MPSVMNGRFIAYYRVSTQKQGESGLGLEAQREAVLSYLNGGKWNLLEEYVEVESGKKSERPQLAAAMEKCRKQKATLVIAKLDRLARNVHFISGLMESKADFIALDMPNMNPFTVHIYAAMAEEYARQISEKTREALAAAKARGVVLGKNGRENGWKLAEANREAANTRAKNLTRVVWEIRNDGHSTIREIAAELNRREIPTARGGRWRENTTHRLLSRIEHLATS